ncbi:MAG: ribonuclease HII [Candidatus Doudnabacteria bacterium]|nr:ribonuclease HII [Candidatus Doudnabacteria bacterium]
MDIDFENKKLLDGYSVVIGCDEVGRGCLAGPVVASAVIMKPGVIVSNLEVRKIKDSKLLSAKKREELVKVIEECSIWSIAEVEEEVIDKINIHNASLLAMKKAIMGLVFPHLTSGGTNGAFVCVDGKFVIPELDIKQQAIVGGDNKIFSIAAASIIAKVYRDELMNKLHIKHPEYNFAKHKGYATLYHRQMIQKHGLAVCHRRSFCKKLFL